MIIYIQEQFYACNGELGTQTSGSFSWTVYSFPCAYWVPA